MNERIEQIIDQAYCDLHKQDPNRFFGERTIAKKVAELIVQDCANFVRETYDHEAAESIAWTMEINYGLHGDYA